MTKLQDDDRLEDRFRQLRADTERPEQVPDFGVMLAKAKGDAEAGRTLQVVKGGGGARRFRRPGVWASVALAATVAGLLLTSGDDGEDAEFTRLVASYSSDASAGAWRSPTSGLLEVPGMELVRTLPSIGGSLRGVDPASLPPRPEAREENG